MRRWHLVVALVVGLSPRVGAAEPEGPVEAAPFGPTLEIEAIEIRGNTATASRVIERALPLEVGDTMVASDPRLVGARYKVLALGFFRGVTLELRRGSRRGQVVLVVTVEERGTIVLNRLWYGASTSSPYWGGADLSERNLLGTGISLGGAAIYAQSGDIEGSRDQWAGELRVGDQSIAGSRFGWQLGATWIHGSEPFRVSGAGDDDHPSHFRGFSYRRRAGRAQLSYDLAPFQHLMVGLRAERIDANLPTSPVEALPDGPVVPIELGLEDGKSWVTAAAVGFDHDDRPDPVLPHQGQRLTVIAEGGAGDYDFAVLSLRWEKWLPLFRGKHTIGLRGNGAIALGDPPRFDLVHLGDVNRMMTPRALGMTLSTTFPFGFASGEVASAYEEGGASLVVEYAFQLFRRRGQVFGGDLFVGGGGWGLWSRPAGRRQDLPYGLIVDAGLRLDTELGIFELTVANLLGRVSL